MCLGRECRLGKSSYEERLLGGTTLYLNSTEDLFSVRRELVENIAEELHRFQPDLLLVNPVYLHWILRRANAWQIELPRVQAVLSTYQYLSEIQRRAIQASLDAPVYSIYSATDLGGCGLGVESWCGHMHLREDHCELEVIGSKGALDDGRCGAFVVTTHASRVMPLLRYVIGDVGLFTNQACECPLSHWRTIEVHGRAKDMLRARGGWVTTRDVDQAVSQVQGSGSSPWSVRSTAVAREGASFVATPRGPHSGSRLAAQSCRASASRSVGVAAPESLVDVHQVTFDIARATSASSSRIACVSTLLAT